MVDFGAKLIPSPCAASNVAKVNCQELIVEKHDAPPRNLSIKMPY